MNNTEKKPFGEDKLGKLVRLMKRYEDEVNCYISLDFSSNGSGVIWAGNNQVYDFRNTEELMTFLESGQLKRTLMVRG